MAQFRIISEQGVDFGTYEAATEAEAYDLLCRDAGYAGAREADEVCGEPFKGQIVEVAS